MVCLGFAHSRLPFSVKRSDALCQESCVRDTSSGSLPVEEGKRERESEREEEGEREKE